jgi:hypothetical protein
VGQVGKPAKSAVENPEVHDMFFRRIPDYPGQNQEESEYIS